MKSCIDGEVLLKSTGGDDPTRMRSEPPWEDSSDRPPSASKGE